MALGKAVLLDRDGTLNVDHGYVGRPEDLQWIEGTFEALHILAQMGYDLFVVSNQSGLAREKYSWADLLNLERQMQSDLHKAGIRIESWLYCPHLPEISGPCNCRKPHADLLRRALGEKYAPHLSWMVGDSPRDLEAGLELGMRVAGVQSGKKPMELSQSIVFENLLEFARALELGLCSNS